jgi:peptide/nickel transport system substrate-binding protein
MPMRLRIKTVILAACLMVSALPAKAAPPATDELVIGITQYPSTFHPNIDSMLAKTYVLSFTRRPFTAYDADWKLVCMLCVTLPTIENGLAIPEKTPEGKQGIAVTYTIRGDANWGDGIPVKTKDVVFTWKVGRHKKTGVSNLEFYRSLYKIDARDDKTFTFHFDKLTFDFSAIKGFELIPAHLDEGNFSDPESYKNRTVFDTDTTNRGLFYGPYRITKTVTGSHVVLEPNPTWWGKKPAFKRITIRVIPNTATLEANLLSGNINMIAGELGLTVDQALAFEKRHGDKFKILYKPGLIYEHLDLNLDNPILKDIRVRQALILGIDRNAISQKLFSGRQPIAHSSVNPLDWVYAGDIRKYPFDPKQANTLLDEAGWTVRKGAIRHNKQGQRLTLDLMTTAGNRTRELVEQVLQNQWKAIGVDVRIKNEPARVLFGQTVTQRKFTGLVMYAWYSAPESVPRTTLHSEHIPHKDNNFAGQNYTGFRNAVMDKLLERIEVELDKKKRAKLWRRLQEIYVAELPVIPLFFRADPYILPKGMTGLVPTGHQDLSPLWVEEWRISR